MKSYLLKFGYLIFLILLFRLSLNLNAQTVTKVYLADSITNFPNPERGFAPCIDPPWPATPITWGFQECEGYTYEAWTAALNLDTLKMWRTRGNSIFMIRYHIAAFRNSELSSAFLSRLNSDFEMVRKAGLKMIPRFTYNWPMGGPDAPIEIVLKHIEQLKPVFKQNVDVIYIIDFGFIGCWGENHHSCYGLVDGMWEPNTKTWQILDSLFNAVPSERMISLRYPFWKFRYFGSGRSDKPIAPVSETEAYTGTIKSRWAHIDDCLACGEWDVGTWNNNRMNAKEVIDFLSNDNRFVNQGGEPGGLIEGDSTDTDKDGYVTPDYSSCDRMRWILKKERWNYLNASSDNNSNSEWKNSGCWNEIARSLGYRFRLVQSQMPTQIKVGGLFSMSFIIHNDGWASPHNPRGLEIVFRNKQTGALSRHAISDGQSIPMDHTHDPRFWEGGKEVRVSISFTLPPDVKSGEYDVLLNLPDPLLYARPDYSIRLANMNTWEESTGFNSLLHTVRIKD
jgi:hypothetical protein